MTQSVRAYSGGFRQLTYSPEPVVVGIIVHGWDYRPWNRFEGQAVFPSPPGPLSYHLVIKVNLIYGHSRNIRRQLLIEAK